jgi:hypothetical protein
MVPFKDVIGPLTAALGLAVVLERFLELLSNISERFLSGLEGRKIPKINKADQLIQELEDNYKINKESESAEERVESSLKQRTADKKALEETKKKIDEIKTKLEKTSNPQEQKQLEKTLDPLQTDLHNLKTKLAKDEEDGEWDERFSNATIVVEDATDPDDGLTFKRFIIQLLGFALGIIFVRVSGIQLFNNLGVQISDWSDYLLTGLLIGGGSAPIHILIRFITDRKIIATPQLEAAEHKETPPAVETANSETAAIVIPFSDISGLEWVDIPYHGGVDREKLEGIHKRKDNPDMIVYHHTSMNRESTFEDVVRLVKSRTDSKGNHWVTGYHCVVQASGSIHQFCRWDRYGNHAVGYNKRSLGISFNGNFETDPTIPFSNPDGRMGPPTPTEEQLKAGARVVTFWTFIYNIEVDFDKLIIPHNQISSKTCPGSAFPYDDLKKWIDFYQQHWEKSETIKERIEMFKQKPYLYI